MALQIRRGLEADRLSVTPAEGELLYTTDETTLYVGDGTTPGGNIVTGSSGGGLNNVVEDTTPQLGGNLDVNGNSIVSTSNGNINIDPDGTGNIVLHGNLNISSSGNFSNLEQINFQPTVLTSFGSNNNSIDGNVFITRNTYSSAFGAGFTFAQHHDTADAVNFSFYRSRGTGVTPTATLNGDDIVDINFFGRTDTATTIAASFSVQIDGVPSSTHIPGKFVFATDNGTSQGVRAELSAAGVWKTNSIANYSGAELLLTATTIKAVGNVQINAQGDLRFADADSTNYVGFQAPTTVSTNVVWTLPAADGGAGEVLTTDGAGTLSWAVGGSSSGASRSTLPAITTASLADGASEDLAFSGYKGYVLYKIETSDAAWVRLYTSEAARTADAGRLEGVDPLPGSGVVAEIITTGADTILISPGAIGFSSEASPTSAIPCTITNKAGVTTTITVTVTALQLEV